MQLQIKQIDVNDLSSNWKKTNVQNYDLHKICSRVCSFPPNIPRFFIEKYSKPGDVVCDVWAGKGTVPFEALKLNRRGIGNDASPEAYVLIYAKTHPVALSKVERYLNRLEKKMKNIEIDKELSELDKKAQVFYSPKTFSQIRKLKAILADDLSDEGIFVKAVILGLLHGTSRQAFSLRCSHSYSMSPEYVKKYAKKHGLRRPTRNVIYCIREKARMLLVDSYEASGVATNDDSRKLSIKSSSVDLVITSPPYFNIQTYAWCNWLRLWFLGHDFREVRKKLAESGVPEKYKSFMSESIKEIYRILKPGGLAFIVIGDVGIWSGKKKVYVNTAEFLLPSVTEAGFVVEQIVLDRIPKGRKVITYLSEDQGIKTERVLYLRKPVHGSENKI